MTNNINFLSNTKTYSINGDESKTISINTTDFAIIDRITKSLKSIDELANSYKSVEIKDVDNASNILSEFDKKIRTEIDYIFDSEVSDIAFGKMNCLSLCADGSAIYENFLNAIIPIIKKDMNIAKSNQTKRIASYTNQVNQATE